MTQVREETAIADKTRSIEQLLNYFQKTVDKRILGWYNNTRRQAQGQTSGGLAQLGERLHGMQEVTGSIPVISTRTKALHGNVWCFFVAAKRVRV